MRNASKLGRSSHFIQDISMIGYATLDTNELPRVAAFFAYGNLTAVLRGFGCLFDSNRNAFV